MRLPNDFDQLGIDNRLSFLDEWAAKANGGACNEAVEGIAKRGLTRLIDVRPCQRFDDEAGPGIQFAAPVIESSRQSHHT